MIPRVAMRRRSAEEVPPTEPTEKGNRKSHTNRICLLVSLSLFFWALLLYFHFAVIGSSSTNIDKQIHLQPQPQPSSSTSLRVDKFPLDPPKEKDKPILPPAPVANTFNPPRIVEKHEFPFVRALKTVDNKSDPCGGKYIYVHDLPSRLNEDMLRDFRCRRHLQQPYEAVQMLDQ
ncbi:unnamed protein product [Eruca vesicaria subsp. sativa]|uniref:Uncharacterized protein n=1 Tax=Eruca vesicaria subsp. sativa TaxID=29727 RepID=A0ABC8JET7_ERUVS|nr:unnamed protein product [Eruca vesicaria subsp. sativa]